MNKLLIFLLSTFSFYSFSLDIHCKLVKEVWDEYGDYKLSTKILWSESQYDLDTSQNYFHFNVRISKEWIKSGKKGIRYDFSLYTSYDNEIYISINKYFGKIKTYQLTKITLPKDPSKIKSQTYRIINNTYYGKYRENTEYFTCDFVKN